MAHIRIFEKANAEGFAVRVAMGDEGEFEASVKPPFEVGEEVKARMVFRGMAALPIRL